MTLQFKCCLQTRLSKLRRIYQGSRPLHTKRFIRVQDNLRMRPFYAATGGEQIPVSPLLTRIADLIMHTDCIAKSRQTTTSLAQFSFKISNQGPTEYLLRAQWCNHATGFRPTILNPVPWSNTGQARSLEAPMLKSDNRLSTQSECLHMHIQGILSSHLPLLL